jgi:hypothetical protein
MRKSTLLQIMAVSMLSLFSQAATDTAGRPSVDPAIAPVATIKPLEVRTRRLHLVRPDLLHYPIQYDTFC